MTPPATLVPPATQTAPQAAASLEASVCLACGHLHAPARRYRCQACGGDRLGSAMLALRGAVETFTRKETPGGAPVGLALVRLEAGPLVTGVLEPAATDVRIGLAVDGRVESVFQDSRTVERFVFAPAEAPEPLLVVAVPAEA